MSTIRSLNFTFSLVCENMPQLPTISPPPPVKDFRCKQDGEVWTCFIGYTKVQRLSAVKKMFPGAVDASVPTFTFKDREQHFPSPTSQVVDSLSEGNADMTSSIEERKIEAFKEKVRLKWYKKEIEREVIEQLEKQKLEEARHQECVMLQKEHEVRFENSRKYYASLGFKHHPAEWCSEHHYRFTNTYSHDGDYECLQCAHGDIEAWYRKSLDEEDN
jgi:hypothetical protein